MKKSVFAGLLVTTLLTCGCLPAREPIKAGSIGARTGVFREASAGSPIPQGYADLQVVSSLKTHKEGVYPLRKDAHGTPSYSLVLTIDGQTAQIKGSLIEENCEPRRLQDPEAGDGIRYAFRTVVRLKAGTHTVIVASPDDEATVEREISLAEGSSNSLVLEPIYGPAAQRGLPTYYGPTSFLGGIIGFRMVLNGKQ